jgi:hypothetical protein
MDEVKGYVNAQVMLEMLEQYQGCYFPHSVAVRIVNKLVQTDVEPVVHAKWIKNVEMRRVDGHIYDYCCSACSGFAQKGCYNNYDRLTPYCAECGAKMDGRVEQADE